jgi:formamidopyrimidine-DNA glycosylase
LPELPEVQTIVDDLRGLIRDWTVVDFSSLWKKNVCEGKIGDFKKAIIGKKVVDVSRRAKYILIELDNGKGILIHLRMTGALLAQISNYKCQITNNFQFPVSNLKKDVKANEHVRHGWLLKKGNNKNFLLFSDVRKFGTIDLVDFK